MPHERKVGVLLAGGESRRFGVPKAFSSYKGKAMYQWALDALAPLVEKTVVISHPTLIERFKQECALPVLEDEEKYHGQHIGPPHLKYQNFSQHLILPLCILGFFDNRE